MGLKLASPWPRGCLGIALHPITAPSLLGEEHFLFQTQIKI